MNRLIDASRPDTVPCQPDIIHHIHKAFRLCLPGTQACTVNHIVRRYFIGNPLRSLQYNGVFLYLYRPGIQLYLDLFIIL